MPEMFFYCRSLANPTAQMPGLRSLCILSSLLQAGGISKCKEFLILFRVRSLVPQEAAGIAFAMHFQRFDTSFR